MGDAYIDISESTHSWRLSPCSRQAKSKDAHAHTHVCASTCAHLLKEFLLSLLTQLTLRLRLRFLGGQLLLEIHKM